LFGITTPGTYSVGSGGKGILSYRDAGGLWTSLGTGADGTITITDISSTHIAASFHATVVPNSATAATGTKSITEGDLDLALKPFGVLGSALPELSKR
jgi:hypothetical protein